MRNSSVSFSQQKIDLNQSPIFFPSGLENFFLLIYFAVLPYIAGLLFIFIYISDMSIEKFISFNDNTSFILTWTIGYEILAFLSILFIIKSAISFSIKNASNNNKKFRRP